jgi:hypothetical protein
LIDGIDERRYFLWWKAVFLDVTADELGDQRLVNGPGGRSCGLHRNAPRGLPGAVTPRCADEGLHPFPKGLPLNSLPEQSAAERARERLGLPFGHESDMKAPFGSQHNSEHRRFQVVVFEASPRRVH